MRIPLIVVTVLLGILAGAGGCQSAGRHAGNDAPPLFDGIGSHVRPVTTESSLAQRYFNQGLVWTYAFNHEEAIRAFEQAARLDPDCGMAWWGVALCHGPHINNPEMPPERVSAAWNALNRAQALRAKCTPVERALIEALTTRYVDPAPADRTELDRAYAAAMERVWRDHRQDADVGTLYAEALMNLQPWDLWTRDGQPKGNTLAIIATLEEVLALNPDHPGANHLYIHAVEAGPNPALGVASAERLRTAVPIAGHLVHMPSHIDVQIGRWALAADTNERAIAADTRYEARSPRQGFYRVYMAHNRHFLAFASMMEGRSAVALRAAREMIAATPDEFIRQKGALIDPLMMIELDVLKRFGRWEEILELPPPRAELPITRCFWHFTRGVACAALDRPVEAEAEQRAFRAAVAAIPADALMQINPAHDVLKIADLTLAGEIAFRRGHIDQAIADLRQAVAREDELRYMEPPDWSQPVRHALGAVLSHAGRFAEAEQVYRADLEVWPENGWSLYGLARSLRGLGQDAAAEEVERRFARTWSRADVKIGSSCLCVPGVAAADPAAETLVCRTAAD